MKKRFFCFLIAFSMFSVFFMGCTQETSEEVYEEEPEIFESDDEPAEIDFSLISFLTDDVTIFDYPLEAWDYSTLCSYGDYYQLMDDDIYDIAMFESDETQLFISDRVGNTATIVFSEDSIQYSFNINESFEIPDNSFISCPYEMLNKNNFLKYYSTYDGDISLDKTLEWPDDYTPYSAIWLPSENNYISIEIKIDSTNAVPCEIPLLEKPEAVTEEEIAEEPQIITTTLSITFMGRELTNIDPADFFRNLGGEIDDDGEGGSYGSLYFDDEDLSCDYSCYPTEGGNEYNLCISDYSESAGYAVISINGIYGSTQFIDYSQTDYIKGNLALGAELKQALGTANGDYVNFTASGFACNGYLYDNNCEVNMMK